MIKKYIPKIETIKDEDKKVAAYMAFFQDMRDKQDKQLAGKNRMTELVETGALSATKAGNIFQVLTAPGIMTDTKGKAIPVPVLKSYSEGLDSFSY